MSGRVLGIIGAYGVSAAFDPRREGRKPAQAPGIGAADGEGDEAGVTGEPQVRRIA